MFDETNKNENGELPVSSDNPVPADNNESNGYFSVPDSLDGSVSSVSGDDAVSVPAAASEIPPFFEAPATEIPVHASPAIETPVSEETQASSFVHVTEPVFSPTTSDNTPAEPSVSGYEWNPPSSGIVYEKEAKEKKASKSEKGYRTFITIILAVFALSILTMSVAVISYIVSLNNPSSGNDGAITENTGVPEISTNGTVNDIDYNSVKFEFDDHSGETLSIPQIAAKCTPSCVGIIAEVEVAYDFPYYFSPSTYMAEASGSGFIYSSEGYIITNHHVIEDSKSITVVLHDGTKHNAELIGSDSLSDIAVLKISPDESTTLIPIEIGDSDNVVVGEQVVAIGCPAGVKFIGTVTDGIVSAINRDVELTDDYGRATKIMTLIQTNATINHGNSGGPLINTKGQVIGINTLKLARDYEGIGFSIPINGAVAIIEQLIEHGKVVERPEVDYVNARGIIGINGTAITEEEANYYKIPVGVLVVQIANNSPAAQAGLRRGDIITHYNGTKISTIADINSIKGNAKAGELATITVYRIDDDNNGKSFDITFKLMAEE